MNHYVYIIQSLLDASYYKGYSNDPANRLAQHNNKESSYTSAKTPWKLVYVELCADKTIALKRERALKKYSHEQIKLLAGSTKNIVQEFISVG